MIMATHTTQLLVISTARAGLALGALLAGCAGSEGIGPGPSLGLDREDPDSDTDDRGTDGNSSGESSGDEPPVPGVCGDGKVDAGEDCDDGVHGACNADCTLVSSCGDALRNGAGEACDDGNASSDDGCLADCSIPESCEAIKDFDSSAPDGFYIVDPDGEGGEDDSEVFCDMSFFIAGWGESHSLPDAFGWTTAGADVAVDDVGGDPRPEIVILYVDDPAGDNHGYYRIGRELDEDGVPILDWSESRVIPGSFGLDTTGAGLALADVDLDGNTDLVVSYVGSGITGDDHGYYRIGWSLDQYGQVADGWSDAIEIPGNFGSTAAEAGTAVLDLDDDGAMDIISFHVREPFLGLGETTGHYQIGWGIDESGQASAWSDEILIPGAFAGAAAGITVVDAPVAGDSPAVAPSLLVFNVSGDRGFLRVGRRLDETGNPGGGWSDPVELDGSWSPGSQFGGVSAYDLGHDGSTDIVFFHVDTESLDDRGYYRWAHTL
jgi:cysteine-rich repeat protein